MTETIRDDATQSTIIDILTDHYPNHEPFVRYAFPREDGSPKQEPILRSIHEQIPEDAKWVSAIYLLTEHQRDRLNEHLDAPYTNLSSDNIAKTIQDECEDAGRVLYSVLGESDEYDEDDETDPTPLTTIADWLQEFVREVVGITPDDCTFYFSGGRSIHAHSPLFMTGDNLRWLKERTKQFCNETDAVLDASVYKQKQQFRLPGAVHRKYDGTFQKAEIDPNWTHRKIIKAASADVDHPDTYAEVLKTIYSPRNADTLSEFLLSSSVDETESDSTLSKWQSRYGRYDTDQRRAHTAPGFYPYPTGDDHDGRSVASIRVVGEPFQRREAGQLRTFVPCFFYGAHSCSGREYTKNQHYAPLQLSKADKKKWDYEEGNQLIIIGGGNYDSIIHKVDEAVAKQVGELLDPDDGDRDDAIDHLQTEGYDIGSAGRSQSTNSFTDQQSPEDGEANDDAKSETRAAKLQRRAEQGCVEKSLGHEERRDVANRLLAIGGWDYAWQWFQEQYGDDFKPQRTWKGIHGVIKTYSEDYDHIDVPPKP